MSRQLIAVDVGNSRIKFGLFDSGAPRAHPGELPTCHNAAVVAVEAPLPWSELHRWPLGGGSEPPESLIAGANPAGLERVIGQWPLSLGPLPRRLEDVTRFPLEVAVDEPARVGIDRLLNAVAANVIRPEQQDVVIIDAGTATTVDSVSVDGVFLGGAILPGFELAARSLHRYTALLPFVSVEELAAESYDTLGRNTREAIRSGLFWGQLGAIKELSRRLTERRDGPTLRLLTGGGAPLLADHLPEYRWEPHLSLQGLVLVDAIHRPPT